MNVCYFGSYDPDYARNRIIIKGLKLNQINVFKCRGSGIVFIRYYHLLKQFIAVKDRISCIIVGFPGHYDVLVAFFLGKIFRKKVFFDVFATLYETYVLDRKIVAKNSFWAYIYFFIDWINFKLADVVISDTKAHVKLYQKLYQLNPDNAYVVYVGSDDDYFFPRKVNEEIDVLFYGSYQPLQGVESIILAAKKLPKVHFKLIGKGQTKPKIEKMIKNFKLRNVELVDWMSMNDLAQEMNQAKIILGIFGNSYKAKSVIPNKVYDAIASRKPVITKESKASKELLNNENSCLVSKTNELAKVIKILLKNESFRNKISSNAYKLYRQKLTPENVTQNLIKIIQ